jgi:hypothetical protein
MRNITIDPQAVTVTPTGTVTLSQLSVDIPALNLGVGMAWEDLGSIRDNTVSNILTFDQQGAAEKGFLITTDAAPVLLLKGMIAGDYMHVLATAPASLTPPQTEFFASPWWDTRIKWSVKTQDASYNVQAKDKYLTPQAGATDLITFLCIKDLVASPESGLVLGSIRRYA